MEKYTRIWIELLLKTSFNRIFK